ncbi:hypothetical protein GCM10020000_14240 [Streptomyces olivoverticillatus]
MAAKAPAASSTRTWVTPSPVSTEAVYPAGATGWVGDRSTAIRWPVSALSATQPSGSHCAASSGSMGTLIQVSGTVTEDAAARTNGPWASGSTCRPTWPGLSTSM